MSDSSNDASVNHLVSIGQTFLAPVRWDVQCLCGFVVAELSTQEAADDTAAWHLGKPSHLGGDRG